MYAISVTFRIKPGHIEDFTAAALAHAANSKNNEAGCLAFSVFVSPGDPALFYFHECYENRQAVEEVHNKAPYFAEFGAKVAPWIADKELRFWQSAG